MRLIPTWQNFLYSGLVEALNHTRHGALGESACVSVRQSRRQMGVAEGFCSESAWAATWASQLSTPSAILLWPLPHFLYTCLRMFARNAWCLPCFPHLLIPHLVSSLPLVLHASLLKLLQVVHISAFSSCAPTWVTYCHNHAAFVSTCLFFYSAALPQMPRSGLAKWHFLPLIHFYMMPDYFIQS